MIAIVNYGSGNIQAFVNIFDRLGVPYMVAALPEELAQATRILLPGVGAFDQAMAELQSSGMRDALDEAVLHRGKPILGICVGMQLLANGSEEGTLPGLGWIDGVVRRFDHTEFHQATHLPHMGWNTIEPRRDNTLFHEVDLTFGYYFLHSYYFACADHSDELAVTYYGTTFTSVVNRGNVYGVQFHPEKSHQAGIQLLRNFALAGG
jgi:imidazole glycerol-phosphate synthase subunit HisH